MLYLMSNTAWREAFSANTIIDPSEWKPYPKDLNLLVDCKGRGIIRIANRYGSGPELCNEHLSNTNISYPCVSIASKTKYIHRLVLEAWIGPCPAGKESCHGDAGPLDYSIRYIIDTRPPTCTSNESQNKHTYECTT